MEELGLSHIINAEGEKIQYALGTLEGISSPNATIDEILQVNKSVTKLLDAVAKNQGLLSLKMAAALNAPTMIGPTGAAGADGIDGLSAYEVAVLNGFIGEELEWLESLIGADGVAGADGATGATGPSGGETGATGIDGLSAYEVAVLNGFIGDELEWLESLIGATGADGAAGTCDCDLADIENRLTIIEESIVDIYEKITIIEGFIYLSDVVQVWSTTPSLSGIGTGIIYSGFTYNFWGIGYLDHSQTLNNGTKYMLMSASQFPDLQSYQGDTTIGTLWIETPAGVVYSLPIRFDETGIYFIPSTQMTNLPAGTTFKFTQALILVTSDSFASSS